MLKQNSSTGIVLNRINYGEADRIITWLTPGGKLSLIAKAVRKQKSKLAGGIELFCESHISYILGRGDIGTLTSARLKKNYKNISLDLERTNLAYSFLKTINKNIESAAGEEWYQLLKNSLAGLNHTSLNPTFCELWFNLHWLTLTGHSPNLTTDNKNSRLEESSGYGFDLLKMAFFNNAQGSYSKNHIKLLRLAQKTGSPLKLGHIKNTQQILNSSVQLSKAMLKTHASI